jgi:hypothetical protein
MYDKILGTVDGTHGVAWTQSAAKQNPAHAVVNEVLTDYTLAPSAYYQRVIQSVREAGEKTLADARQLDVESTA